MSPRSACGASFASAWRCRVWIIRDCRPARARVVGLDGGIQRAAGRLDVRAINMPQTLRRHCRRAMAARPAQPRDAF